MPNTKPLIAVTMGDPAGIGPEIIVGAWSESVVHEWCRPLVVGHPEIIRRAVALWGTGVRVEEIDGPEAAQPSPDVIPCIPCGSDEALDVEPGKLDARAGQAAYDAVVAAIHLAVAGRVDAITTAPLQKEALHRAGHEYPGHTELLAHVCGIDDYAMMLYLGPSEDLLPSAGLAVVHVTLHTALKSVFGQLTEEAILSKARLADRFMARLMPKKGSGARGQRSEIGGQRSEIGGQRSEIGGQRSEIGGQRSEIGGQRSGIGGQRSGIGRSRPPNPEIPKSRNPLSPVPFSRPRIGVCALNPHAGEGGLFGDEELLVIRPAVERGIAEGLRLEGPLPVDTLMVQARDGRFDAVVAMYHDQGHIALKLLGMHRAVNVTLGLPIIRTSVAHGTAFDIAWQRRAETGSMIEALRVASRLAVARKVEGGGMKGEG